MNISIIIIIIIVILIIIAILFYLYYLNNNRNINSKKISYFTQSSQSNSQSSKVVLLKTHIWNDSLEKYALKLFNETSVNNIDFFILMHTENGKLPSLVKDVNLKKLIIKFTENDIKSIYKQGFFSIWLSNHWILMWFYKKNSKKYQYYWSVEYDTRISGNSSIIWNYDGVEDFIYPYEPWQDPNWIWKNHYVGGKMIDKDKYYGYLQITRYSANFLNYLDNCFTNGENGQDEMILFSLFKRGKFTGSSKLLFGLIKDTWSVDPKVSDSNRKKYHESENKYKYDNKNLVIFHPIKDI